MSEVFSTPDDGGDLLASDFTTSMTDRLAAQAADTIDPKNHISAGYLFRRAREAIAGGDNLAPGMNGEMDVYSGIPLEQQQANYDAQRAAIPDISSADARAMLKQEGLSESDVHLGDAPSHKLPVLQLRINEAHERRDREAAIARGPQGFFPDALGFVTSLGVGMVDPVNIAAFSIPVIGEARMGKIMASAGDSILARGAARFGQGAAQGAVGTALLQPADWWLHTQDGQDYTMAQAMESVIMGAGMGGAFHAVPGGIGDLLARWRGQPLAGSPQELLERGLAAGLPAPAATPPEAVSDEVPRMAPVHPAEILADLPASARVDAVHAVIADILAGRPTRAAEMLEIAADHDPRLAESMEMQPEPLSSRAARDAVFADIHAKLIDAGVSPEEAAHYAAVVASSHAALAERLNGAAGNALDLYRAEGLQVRADDLAEAEGRAFEQPAMVDGVRVDFPDADHIALFELGRKLSQSEPVDEAEARRLFDRFKGFVSEADAPLDTTEDLRDAALEYHDYIDEEVRKGQGGFRATDMIDPELKEDWYRRALDEAVAAKEPGQVRRPVQLRLFQSHPTAPTFYSAVGRAIENAKQEKASPEQWLGMLKNAAGVKPEEMQWLGLEDWLKQQNGSVTRQQLQDYIRANQIEVQEVVKGGARSATDINGRTDEAAAADREVEEINSRLIEKYGGLGEAFQRWTDAEREEFDAIHGAAALERSLSTLADAPEHSTKYESYRLPGGDNYRELLLTLPRVKPDEARPAPDIVEKYRGEWVAAVAEKRAAEDAEMLAVDAWHRLAGKAEDHARLVLLNALYGAKQRTADAWKALDDLNQKMVDETIARQPQKYGEPFTHRHWEDPNVVSHIRFDDRTSDGKKTLHIAEVQSDWHQAGRRQGYKQDASNLPAVRNWVSFMADKGFSREEALERWNRRSTPEDVAFHNEHLAETESRAEAINKAKFGIPDAPFKTTWPELAMKRMIRYAAENGYDRISWDTGATNADRFDLSKQISRIKLEDNSSGGIGRPKMDGPFSGGMLYAYGKDGRELFSKWVDQPEQLPDLIGKEAADKIMAVKPIEARSAGFGVRQRKLEGLDLKVGGEGMQGFYDKILPATVGKLVKRFGAKVENGRLSVERYSDDPIVESISRMIEEAGDTPEREKQAASIQVHSVDITPELRKAAVEQGFPLFQSDRGGRDVPVTKVDPAKPVGVVELNNLPPRSRAEAKSDLRAIAGTYRTASGEEIVIATNSAKKALSGYAGDLKRSLAASFGRILENAVVYGEAGNFDYAAAHLRLDGQDFAVRIAIRKDTTGGAKFYQLEGFEIAPNENPGPHDLDREPGAVGPTISGPEGDRRARSTSATTQTIGDLVGVFNRQPPGAYPLLQSRPAEPRRHGIPDSAGEIISSHRDDKAIKASADYAAAKAGDNDAALRLVKATVDPATINEARQRFGPDAIYTPVAAREAGGHNKIPHALAVLYAHEAGGTVDDSIVQANRAYHTGAGPMERLANPAHFAGDVIKGGKYVIVDDVSVMGSTLAGLADHIQKNGGEVAGVVTLVNASRTGILRPSKAHVADIERRYGDEVRRLFHAEPSALTADEAAYVRNFRDADALRAAEASARGKRLDRLHAKGLGGGNDEDLRQGGAAPRGRITLSDAGAVIDLFKAADRSTFLHEMGHLYLDQMMRYADHPAATDQMRADRDAVLRWLGVERLADIGTTEHEKWADGFERYLAEGNAPSSALARAFDAFKRWLIEIYGSLSRVGGDITPEIRGVMDRMLATDKEIADRADERNAVTRIVKPKAPTGRAAADPETWSLFEYLASKGGLRPDPELEAIFGNKRGPFVPGFGALIRKGGLRLDEALRAAKDGRYLFDEGDVSGAEGRLTPRDLLDKIDDESRKHKVYRIDHAATDRAIDREEEAKHILDALHSEIEAATGEMNPKIDPAIERRVVEIVQREGEHDVHAAYERAIMEDAQRDEGITDERRAAPEDHFIPGWDVPDDAGTAPPGGGTAAADGGPAGHAGSGQSPHAGEQPRAAGGRDRTAAKAKLKSSPAVVAADPRWRALADVTPDYDDPEVVAESEAAAKLPEPDSLVPEKSLTALERAAADAEAIWRQLEPALTDDERTKINDIFNNLQGERSAQEQIIRDGAACLLGAIG